MHECVHGSAVCILHSRLANLIVTHIFTLIIWCNGDGKESLYYLFFLLLLFFSQRSIKVLCLLPLCVLLLCQGIRP